MDAAAPCLAGGRGAGGAATLPRTRAQLYETQLDVCETLSAVMARARGGLPGGSAAQPSVGVHNGDGFAALKQLRAPAAACDGGPGVRGLARIGVAPSETVTRWLFTVARRRPSLTRGATRSSQTRARATPHPGSHLISRILSIGARPRADRPSVLGRRRPRPDGRRAHDARPPLVVRARRGLVSDPARRRDRVVEGAAAARRGEPDRDHAGCAWQGRQGRARADARRRRRAPGNDGRWVARWRAVDGQDRLPPPTRGSPAERQLAPAPAARRATPDDGDGSGSGDGDGDGDGGAADGADNPSWLVGSGMLLWAPPYGVEDELREVLTALGQLLKSEQHREVGTEGGVARESIPRKSIPRESIPRVSIPRESIPRESIPRDSIPRESRV